MLKDAKGVRFSLPAALKGAWKQEKITRGDGIRAYS
uniref:Uncharacterized protein n=1 Tax=Klebsiella phage FKP3 TaxID=3231233 RepID=A0AAU8HZJ6_9CAUD